LYRAGKLSDGSPRKHSSGTAAKDALLPVVISARRSSSSPALPTAVHSVASSRAHESDIVHVTLASGAMIRIEGKLRASPV
jgi:hypothetical protein